MCHDMRRFENMVEDKVTLKTRPKLTPSNFIDQDELVAYNEWFEDFEKKHRDFVHGKIYDWLEANVPNWSSKGCRYMNILMLFIEKEVLGDATE